MRFFGLKSCDSCRKALKDLAAAGVSPTVVDVRADGVTRPEIERFFAEFGGALVNRRSTTWRGLSADEQAGDPADLLTRHPTLMKRPVIETDAGLFLGWDAKTRAAVLGSGG